MERDKKDRKVLLRKIYSISILFFCNCYKTIFFLNSTSLHEDSVFFIVSNYLWKLPWKLFKSTLFPLRDESSSVFDSRSISHKDEHTRNNSDSRWLGKICQKFVILSTKFPSMRKCNLSDTNFLIIEIFHKLTFQPLWLTVNGNGRVYGVADDDDSKLFNSF